MGISIKGRRCNRKTIAEPRARPEYYREGTAYGLQMEVVPVRTGRRSAPWTSHSGGVGTMLRFQPPGGASCCVLSGSLMARTDLRSSCHLQKVAMVLQSSITAQMVNSAWWRVVLLSVPLHVSSFVKTGLSSPRQLQVPRCQKWAKMTAQHMQGRAGRLRATAGMHEGRAGNFMVADLSSPGSAAHGSVEPAVIGSAGSLPSPTSCVSPCWAWSFCSSFCSLCAVCTQCNVPQIAPFRRRRCLVMVMYAVASASSVRRVVEPRLTCKLQPLQQEEWPTQCDMTRSTPSYRCHMLLLTCSLRSTHPAAGQIADGSICTCSLRFACR